MFPKPERPETHWDNPHGLLQYHVAPYADLWKQPLYFSVGGRLGVQRRWGKGVWGGIPVEPACRDTLIPKSVAISPRYDKYPHGQLVCESRWLCVWFYLPQSLRKSRELYSWGSYYQWSLDRLSLGLIIWVRGYENSNDYDRGQFRLIWNVGWHLINGGVKWRSCDLSFVNHCCGRTS